MAPILSAQQIVASAYAPAPHTLKQTTATSPAPEPTRVPPQTPQCQVCFDNPEDCDGDFVTALCSRQCPAVLCKNCVSEHIRVAVNEAFAGVLPKVRCPVCLAAMNKSRWQHLAASDVVAKYAAACATACGYRSPCCHDTDYTQLPVAFDARRPHRNYREPAPLMLVPSLKHKLPLLQQLVRKFANHKRASRVVVSYLEDAFGRHVPLSTQHLIMEHLLPRILDEERRATLFLSYHAKYKTVTTRCCGYVVCFNCKRLASNHKDGEGGPCDDAELDAACIVSCRSCHVTMVKVEGCDAVVCWCGFSMSWVGEVELRDRHKRGLVPVDIHDMELYDRWCQWRNKMSNLLNNHVLFRLRKLRMRRIDQWLETKDAAYTGLRAAVQSHVWWWRWRRSLPQLESELRQRSMEKLARKLRKYDVVTVAVSRWAWKSRFNTVVATVRRDQFWLGYFNEHRAELIELKLEERAMLMPGLCM